MDQRRANAAPRRFAAVPASRTRTGLGTKDSGLRTSLPKWQTADPMGYPENAPEKLRFGGKPRAQRCARRARKGPRWNAMAYCGNGVTSAVDLWGCATVYTWPYKGSDEAWGHASLELTNGTYISWWPASDIVSNNVIVATNRHYVLNTGYIDIYCAVAVTNSFQDDVFCEDGEPSTTNIIYGLDEAAIETYWQNQVTNSLWESYKWE